MDASTPRAGTLRGDQQLIRERPMRGRSSEAEVAPIAALVSGVMAKLTKS